MKYVKVAILCAVFSLADSICCLQNGVTGSGGLKRDSKLVLSTAGASLPKKIR
jgi:hypothetical protein